MKKAFLVLAAAVLLLCSACGSPKETVAGTWYSVTDATMYNFAGGKITASGVTVGQYEDGGDSAVISMLDGTNLQLYVTTMGDIEVLADVREGEGTTYFCKGLETARAFMADALLYEFSSYLEENIVGEWICPEWDFVSTVVFTGDSIEITTSTGEVFFHQITEINTASDEAGTPYAEIMLADAGILTITAASEDYWITDELTINADDVAPYFHDCWINKA